MTDNKVDVSSSSGWLHGRLAVQDHSSGAAEIGPGVDVSIRLEDIAVYHVAELGVLCIGVSATGTFFHIIGSIEVMRKIMSRANMTEA